MRVLIILIVFAFFGCDSPNALDCLQTTGDLVQEEFVVSDFTKIRVRDRIQLVLKQGPETQVIVEAGSNLINDVSAIVEDDVLILRDANACNLIREYNTTTVFITAPDISVIRNESGRTISSDGVLEYPFLRLVSEDFTENERINTDGDFNLDIAVQGLQLEANNLSNFFLRGSATQAYFRIFSGDSRIEAQDLAIQNLLIFHRGTNQMFVNPIAEIRGEIRSGGDVISVNRPPIVEVTEFYTGRLIFQD